MWFGAWNDFAFSFSILSNSTHYTILNRHHHDNHLGHSCVYSIFSLNLKILTTSCHATRNDDTLTHHHHLDPSNHHQNDDDRGSRRNGNGNYDYRARDASSGMFLFLYFIYSTDNYLHIDRLYMQNGNGTTTTSRRARHHNHDDRDACNVSIQRPMCLIYHNLGTCLCMVNPETLLPGPIRLAKWWSHQWSSTQLVAYCHGCWSQSITCYNLFSFFLVLKVLVSAQRSSLAYV